MFTADRYLKAILTVIAVELLWLGLSGGILHVDAWSGATPVVITGVQLDQTGVSSPLLVQPIGTVKIEADHPLKVESVPYTPSPFPGD